jgi:hypothetical protein
VLGDSSKVRYTPLSSAQRFTALQTGEVDMLSRNTTISFQRDAQLGIELPAVDWYDGTAFLVRKALNAKSVKDLDGATICVNQGTTTELDVADYFHQRRLRFAPVVIERLEETVSAYFAAFAQDAGPRARRFHREKSRADRAEPGKKRCRRTPDGERWTVAETLAERPPHR